MAARRRCRRGASGSETESVVLGQRIREAPVPIIGATPDAGAVPSAVGEGVGGAIDTSSVAGAVGSVLIILFPIFARTAAQGASGR